MHRAAPTVNVAVGKPARQSSLSQWSSALGAGGAVTGTMPPDYGFHTDFEPNPWWMVDLERVYPIDRIVIHNRLRGHFERASSCKVDVSEDGVSWRLIHAGVAHFRGGDTGPPLTLPLSGLVSARYVCISLAQPDMLHLAQVEVFADCAMEIRNRYGLDIAGFEGDYSTPRRADLNDWHLTYRFEGQAVTDPDFRLIGLRITPIGRLGNQVIQLINATLIARRLGLDYLVVPGGGLIELAEAFTAHGVTYIPDIAGAPAGGSFLAGNFFFTEDLSKLLQGWSGHERYRVVQDIVRPRLMPKFPALADTKHPDELTLHFRAGDVFGDKSHVGYTQPPLAFYTILARHLLGANRIGRVRLVFEDRGNPCVDAFIAFADAMRLPYRLQSASLAEDLTALIDARYVAYGYGTFGAAACLLSRGIDTLFLFEPLKTGDYDGIPSIGRTVLVRDRAGAYTKRGEWRSSSAEQRQLMLEYPESALEILP